MNNRKIHLDLLRIFAIVLVVFNHTPAYHFPISAQADASWTEFIMLCISIAIKVAVPLFFMISGALLLAKKESLSSLLRKRVFRMLVVLMIFLLAQNFFSYFCGVCTLKQVGASILKGTTDAQATWFLYAYICFLLMLPLLRLLVEKMETQHFLYLIALHLILVEFIPIFQTPLDEWLPFTAHHGYLCNIYIYAILGYYLEHRLSLRELTKKKLCILASASFFSILIGAILVIVPFIFLGRMPSERVSCFTGAVLIPGIFIYLAARKLGERPLPEWAIRIITMLGSACFTVMLTENIFREAISSHFSGYDTEYYPSVLVAFMVCCCSWCCGIIAKRIPYIKNLV